MLTFPISQWRLLFRSLLSLVVSFSKLSRLIFGLGLVGFHNYRQDIDILTGSCHRSHNELQQWQIYSSLFSRFQKLIDVLRAILLRKISEFPSGTRTHNLLIHLLTLITTHIKTFTLSSLARSSENVLHRITTCVQPSES